MNDNEPILTELRKISAWAEMQRKATKWSLICMAVAIPIVIIVGIVLEHQLQTGIEDLASDEQKLDWYDVSSNVRVGDYEKAIRIGEQLIQKTSQDPDAHEQLAEAYLAAGKLEKAKENYAEAYRLFPSDRNAKLLGAISARIKTENPQSNNAANDGRASHSQTNATRASARAP